MIQKEHWRVECEDGDRIVLVSYLRDSNGGWWNAAIEVNGRIENKMSQTGPRNAIARLAGHLAWPVVVTVAPGERSTAERAANDLAQAERRGAEAMRLAAANACEATEEGRRTAEAIRKIHLPGDDVAVVITA